MIHRLMMMRTHLRHGRNVFLSLHLFHLPSSLHFPSKILGSEKRGDLD